jgi:bifunctional DNA-binding transcriptional regulator/antitoxin component of YhaV-PrlF toxin-antitoxin module
MKIIKEKSREYKGTSYFKYKVNIPEMFLRRAGLNSGDELEIETQKGIIILKKIENTEKKTQNI